MNFVWLTLMATLNTVVGMTERTVRVGETVKLPCLSNDDYHRFQYWQLINDQIIGPWNNWSGHKFKYEVATGQLTIHGVSLQESGFYKCVSKSLTNSSLNVGTVELIVERDWVEAFEDDPTVNIYRGLIAFFCILILFLLGVLAFVIRRRARLRGNFEDQEDSPDDAFIPQGRAYNPTTAPYSSRIERKKTGLSNESLLTDQVDTDLRTSFSLPDFGR